MWELVFWNFGLLEFQSLDGENTIRPNLLFSLAPCRVPQGTKKAPTQMSTKIQALYGFALNTLFQLYLSSPRSQEHCIAKLVLQMGKLKHRAVNGFAQGHKGNLRQRLVSNPVPHHHSALSLTPASVPPSFMYLTNISVPSPMTCLILGTPI